ncbi:hypothetical protein A7456_09425 [Moraxella nonliquefaciens]|uniref:Uncharacterized protein n=1 Tax=Moraxella nonliquefaciens TaxID=478 RepID=A0A1B8QQG5_MORNO|nr:hypothetical protein [Moraxella nonliquefaciens]OBX86536.1 hypothetical protein A7456_09425 [Moraxella nonliquefaciens]
MYSSKLKTYLIFYVISFLILFLFRIFVVKEALSLSFMFAFMFSFVFPFFFYVIGLHKILINYFDNQYYAKQDEINFQKNLRRELQRKRALSEIDNENLHYQNQLRIEYIAQVAQIHLHQYLANMYQQAIINNSTQNELTAQKQLLELEAELKKQGLI